MESLPLEVLVRVAHYLGPLASLQLGEASTSLLAELKLSSPERWKAFAHATFGPSSSSGLGGFVEEYQRRVSRCSATTRPLIRAALLSKGLVYNVGPGCDLAHELNAAITTGCSTLFLRAGEYAISQTLEITAAMDLCAEPAAAVVISSREQCHPAALLRFSYGGRCAHLNLVSNSTAVVVSKGHLLVENCIFTAADDGIEADEQASCHAIGCEFTALRCAITLSYGCVENCRFLRFQSSAVEETPFTSTAASSAFVASAIFIVVSASVVGIASAASTASAAAFSSFHCVCCCSCRCLYCRCSCLSRVALHI